MDRKLKSAIPGKKPAKNNNSSNHQPNEWTMEITVMIIIIKN